MNMLKTAHPSGQVLIKRNLIGSWQINRPKGRSKIEIRGSSTPPKDLSVWNHIESGLRHST